jgi:DNA-binding MarR family transcriptional regulator
MSSSDCDALKLDNQVCFPLYAASRLVIQKYKPLLTALDITYPQYLVLMVLWETNGIPVKELSSKLYLETNTLTPLLKRLEQKQMISRVRSAKDERQVIITLNTKGKTLQDKAKAIPNQLLQELECLQITAVELDSLKQFLYKFLNQNK